jgi:ribulose bisphosphate carboxylase small subunit
MKSKLIFLSAFVFLLAMISITGSSFADGGNGVLPATNPITLPNNKPSISVSDYNVFLSSHSDSASIHLLASDPDGDRIKLEEISGVGTFRTRDQISPISVIFYFHPDSAGIYPFIFRATDEHGAIAQDTAFITITFNLPPQLTCPNTQANHINGTYTVSQVIADDNDGAISSLNGFLTGTGLSNFSLTNVQGMGTGHVTADVKYDVINHCAAGGFIWIIGTDNFGAADTCFFGINLSNTAPAITCPSNGNVRSGATFVSTDFSTTDPDGDSITVTILSVSPSVINQPTIVSKHVNWVTTCSEKGNYTIRLLATDPCGYRDTCEFMVNVHNQPPVLTCPDSGSVHSGQKFTSSDFSVNDPDGDTALVTLLSITPSATHNPTIVGSHVEWNTTCAEKGNYIIKLLATDPCGAKDTCQFTVNVYNQPPVLTCPNNGSVSAGQKFTSTDFSYTDPEGDSVIVSVLDITPPATNNPYRVNNHIEWLTTCKEEGTYTIRLLAMDNCGARDTCEFTVNVSNQPPVLTCPDSGSVHSGQKFTSSDFSVTDPDGGTPTVTILSITPPVTNSLNIVSNHIEWLTTCAEKGNYVIRLVATDACGAKDTCEFTVNVYNQPPVLVCPPDDSINAGDKFISSDYSVSDPDDSSKVRVIIKSLTPSPTYPPVIVGKHVEWRTSCNDLTHGPNFTITLIAFDNCGAADTCQFTITVYDLPPVITCPEDDSIHAGGNFVSTDFSSNDPKSEPVTVNLCGITPPPVNQPTIVSQHVEWQTACGDAGKTFTICLVAVDSCGAADTCYFDVTVYNRPPQLTCPNDGIINATQTFISSDFSVIDLDGDLDSVTFLDITPPATNNPTIVGNHVEWVTTISEYGDYIIRLVATDPCGLKDTCQFKVTVYNEATSTLDCPEDDSVHTGVYFISTNYSVTGPGANPDSVHIISITPPPAHQPIKVQYHVEWQTACSDSGKVFTICLESHDNFGEYDTCCFNVTVYNRPPELTCPDSGSVNSGDLFVSTDFTVTDPDSDAAPVTFLSITPIATNDPTIVGSHVEWNTTCAEKGNYVIQLVATDTCGLKDTCYFNVTVLNLALNLTKTDVSCYGDSNGTITATWTGGVSPFMIDINGEGFVSAVSPYQFTDLPEGLYQVVVRDHQHCMDTAETTIAQPSELTCTVSPEDTSICEGDSVRFCVVPTGGTPPYSYLWSGPCGFARTDSCVYARDAGSYSVMVTDAHTCTTRCEGAFATHVCEQEYCTLTQGAYGNCGGHYFGMETLELIQSLLADSALVVGKPGRSITIPYAAAGCVIKRLPGGSSADMLPAIGNDTLRWSSCQTSPLIPVFTDGRFKNVLLTQTITLSLNVRLPCRVGDFELCEEIHTRKADYGDDDTPCTDDDSIMPGSYNISVEIPNAVLTALSNLNLSLDVYGLLELANRALAGWPRGGASLSQINCAVDAINRGFDGCRFVTYCGPKLPGICLNREDISVPAEFSLGQNYPNPFNPTCVIAYSLPMDCQVKLVIYNILGQRVKVLVDEHQDAGYKSVTWDGKDNQDQGLATGIYFYRIEAGNFVQTKKMLLMK